MRLSRKILAYGTVCLLFLAMAAGLLAASPSRVLVVINDNSQASKQIGQFYVSKRNIPAKNVVRLKVIPLERVSHADFKTKIRDSIARHISRHNLKIDFIVTTKGVPLYDDRRYSVDSMLAGMQFGLDTQMKNPYFGKSEPFSSDRFQMYLVTRLDGYSVEDAKALVTRSLCSRGNRGRILIDINPYHDTRKGYNEINKDMRDAVKILRSRNIPLIVDDTDNFVGGHRNLMGYYSWGSNDTRFDKSRYLSLGFKPGAIAETVVSTSARSFFPQKDGQSQIGDLIRNGVTGVKGYVSEPYGDSMAQASILFDRYTRGFNLAESFYMASPFMVWKDVVIGDPLCAPYAK